MARLFCWLFMSGWLVNNLLLWVTEGHDWKTGVQLVVLGTPPTIVLIFFLIYSPRTQH